jgi:hypothetical protein
MTRAGDQADAVDAPPAELADIVIRAGRLGFPRWRVATALGISAGGLASIEGRIHGTARDDGADGQTSRSRRPTE